MQKLPKYCHWNYARGNKFIRFRKDGFSTYLKGVPWSEDFMNQYTDALKGIKRQRQWVVDDFWAYVDKSKGKNSCWLWTKQIDREGYGRMASKTPRYRGDNHLTHRYAWEITHGKIPQGMHVLHHCDNPSCCNPKHLFLGTHQDNMKDRDKKGRWKDHWNMS